MNTDFDPQKWPAASVELVEIEALIPYARNARVHSGDQIAQIAASMREFGWTNPVLLDESGTIIAGHGRVLAARQLGIDRVPVMVARGWSDAQRRAYTIADNKLPLAAAWDVPMLAAELRELDTGELDLALTGFTHSELESLATMDDPRAEPGDPIDETADVIPDAKVEAVSRPGDIWCLGEHRVMCGDSTDAVEVARLVRAPLAVAEDGSMRPVPAATVIHADPPYGMGKDFANDNTQGAVLDAFQMRWWEAWRPYLKANGSAYIWGTAYDLWRLWYARLSGSEPLSFCNEVVWDKKAAGFGGISHMGADSMSVYPHGSERCLFFKVGRHGITNQTKGEYWPGWDAIRLWLIEERERAGFTQAKVNALCKNHMSGHWFGTSQWCLIPAEHYQTLAIAAKGSAFNRPHAELQAEYRELSEQFRVERPAPYFDNTHDAMRDVWEFPRVKGEERFGHATPKPVAMIARAIKSSCPAGALLLEPFAGTGSTLIAAEATGRVCLTMELEPGYVDVCVRRWQDYTKRAATLEGSGDTFEATANARQKAAANLAETG